MMILLFFAFIAGFVTIMAPCIWPLLPIILSASSLKGKYRPLGITLGIMTSFTVFTLSISWLEKIFHLTPNVFRTIAIIIICLLGLTMLFPSLGMKFENIINNLLSPLRGRIKPKSEGFSAGYLIGFSTGLVWAPCSGPILATVATLAATQAVSIKVVAVTLAYIFGLGIPLFIFSLVGSRLLGAANRFTKYTARIQRGFGVLIIAAAFLIYTNYDKTIQLKLLNIFPLYGNFFTRFENNAQVNQQLAALKDKNALSKAKKAPEFAGIAQWLNTPQPLTLAKLRGKTVLIDFWTYTCINCARELPHIVAWYNKYKNNNFIVIGVHTPEFAFEKETQNVQNAIEQFKINYPVALDNDYRTWNAFSNNYWPALYLIDTTGHIRKTDFGEGEYDEMENSIRQLLAESGNPVKSTVSDIKDETPSYPITPETYLGLNRLKRFASHEKMELGKHRFTLPQSIPQDNFAYQGMWDISESFTTAVKNAALEINFKASKVFLVISPNAQSDTIKVFINNKLVNNTQAGSDVKNGRIILDTERLYNIIDLKGKVESYLLRLEFENNGISVYAFTFG